MWSAVSPISGENENGVPETRVVHRKSVGRTPLRVLGNLDPNTLSNKRLSLPKSSVSTDPSKDVFSVCAVPVGFMVDSIPKDSNTEVSSATLSCLDCQYDPEDIASKHDNLKDQTSSTNITCPENNIYVNEGYHTMVSLPPTQGDNEHAFSQKECVSSDSPEKESSLKDSLLTRQNEASPLDQFEVKVNVGSAPLVPVNEAGLEFSLLTTENDASPLDQFEVKVNVGSAPLVPVNEAGLDFSLLTTENEASPLDQFEVKVNVGSAPLVPVNEAGLEFSLLTAENETCHLDQIEAVENMRSANSTFVISSDLTHEPKPSILPSFSVECSDINSSVDCSVFEKGDEDCFHVVSTMYDDSLECAHEAEILPPTLPDDIVTEDKTNQIGDASSAFLDSAVELDKPSSSIISHAILADSLVNELAVDDETSDLIKSDLDLHLSPNKCFTPVGGSTPHSKVLEGIGETEEEPQISSIQKCLSSLISGTQKSDQAEALAENCPTPVIPLQFKDIEGISFGRCVGHKITPRVLTLFHDSGTSTTPVSTSEDFTWTTPILLLNKSMNTSWNLKGEGEKSARDNASETDSLLWKFSKEAICNASREELVNRLEGTLIVIEALSKQIQGWQQHMVSSKPSEQRDCSTQTCVTYCNEAEQYYHNLYLKTLSRQQSLQNSLEDEKQLQQLLKEATETLSSSKSEAAEMATVTENLYEAVQQDRIVLNQKIKHTQALLADYTASMSKVRRKMEDNLLERQKMKTQMEKALLAKEAADHYLKDLQVHSSTVISALRQDLETERQLLEVVMDLKHQQHTYNEELVEFVHRARSVCQEVNDDQTNLQNQCSMAKQLISQYWNVFNIMNEKTRSALEEFDVIKNERDSVVQENQQRCSQLEDLKSQNKQMELENSRLGSELESLMKTVCSLETELDQWRLENAELSDKLAAKDLSVRLLEKELNEATARAHDYQDTIKYLSKDVIPSLELDLSNASSQKEDLQGKIRSLKLAHAKQIASYKESLEFLEQENEVCREQVTETESELKSHHLTLLKRNFECENLKDTIKDLEKEITELKQKLSDIEIESQSTKAKMDKGILDASNEVLKIKGHLFDVIKSLKENSQREVKVPSCGQQTPGRSLSFSGTGMEESSRTTVGNATDSKDQRLEGIWSDTSAFTVVQPLAPPSADSMLNLADVLNDLSSIVSEVITVASFAMDTKQHIIRDLKTDISSLKEELQHQQFQHKSDVRDLQDEVERLKRRICTLDEKLGSKEKYIKGLREHVQQFENKIMQLIEKVNESEDLRLENGKLKLSVKQYENEVQVLKEELALNPADSARNWVQEKLMMHKDLISITMKLNDTEYSKAEVVQKLTKHKDILTKNLARSEAEVQKLDDIVEKIREALFSVPEVVNQCDTLKHLVEFLK